jgi:hypothetical protein
MNDRAVLDRNPVDADFERAGDQAAHAAVRGAAVAALPVAAAIVEALQIEHRRNQRHAFDPNFAGQDREQSDSHVERFERHEIALARRIDIGHPHQPGRQRRHRKHGERDRPVDRDSTAGRRLQPVDDLRLIPVPINEARPNQNRGKRQYDDRHQAIDQRFQPEVLAGVIGVSVNALSRTLARFRNAANLQDAKRLIHPVNWHGVGIGVGAHAMSSMNWQGLPDG